MILKWHTINHNDYMVLWLTPANSLMPLVQIITIIDRGGSWSCSPFSASLLTVLKHSSGWRWGGKAGEGWLDDVLWMRPWPEDTRDTVSPGNATFSCILATIYTWLAFQGPRVESEIERYHSRLIVFSVLLDNWNIGVRRNEHWVRLSAFSDRCLEAVRGGTQRFCIYLEL